jgi:hypothetical protein
VAARGCHGTTCAEPRQLEGLEGTSTSDQEWPVERHWGNTGARWQGVETLAAGRCSAQASEEGAGKNPGGGGVDQAAAYRLRLVAAAGTTGAGGRRRGRRQGQQESERGEERTRSSVVGQV